MDVDISRLLRELFVKREEWIFELREVAVAGERGREVQKRRTTDSIRGKLLLRWYAFRHNRQRVCDVIHATSLGHQNSQLRSVPFSRLLVGVHCIGMTCESYT